MGGSEGCHGRTCVHDSGVAASCQRLRDMRETCNRAPNNSNMFLRAPPTLAFGADVSIGEGALRLHQGYGFRLNHSMHCT